MELKEYLKIIQKNLRTFIFVIFLVTAVGLIYFLFLPISYSTSLTANITRSGKQITESYKYDDFYRLQADEKFAETLVEWMKSPRTVASIYERAGLSVQKMSLKKLSKAIKAQKYSSQIVAIFYSTTDEVTAKKIATAIETTLTENIASLNKNQKEDTWFQIVAQKPLTVQNEYNLFFITGIFILIGIFLSFWVVLIIHYLK